MFAWSRDWVTLLHLLKILSFFHFQLCRHLKQYVMLCARHRACRYKLYQELGVFLTGKFRCTHFVLQKSTNPQNKIFRVQEFCTELCATEDVWKIVSFPNTLPRDVNGEYFAKRKENCTILGSFLDKEVENLDDHGCPKIRYLVDP